MTLRDRYRDLIDSGTSSVPGEPEAFERLPKAGKPPRRVARFAVAFAGMAVAAFVVLALVPRRTPEPPAAQTMSLYVASSDLPDEAMEIVITVVPENRP